jgi:DNA-binding GntR family transcriptional regulator
MGVPFTGGTQPGVIVSERDLAEQLRKRPDAVTTALNLLLSEQRVQRAPLSGYWKLNV